MGRWRKLGVRLGSIHTMLMILMTLGYLLATHLSTIHRLKTAISVKADRTELELLDKKLTRIEVKLEEAVLTKDEVMRLRDYLDRRITETMLRLGNGVEGERKDGK